jgi:mannose-6-phosphate isomerase-like protein (cupin superfamily)
MSSSSGISECERGVFVEPGALSPLAHVHTFQLEQFEVVSGRLAMQLAHESLELEAGEETWISLPSPAN